MKPNIMRTILYLMMLLNASIIYANQALNEYFAVINNHNTIQANFSQVVFDSNKKEVQKMEGLIKLKKPNKIVWHTIKPNEQLIISNGKKAWIFDKDLEQVSIRNNVKQFNLSVFYLLINIPKDLSNHFDVSSKHKNNQKEFYFTSKDDETEFDKFTIIFNQDRLTKIIFDDKLDNHSIITFSNIKINDVINDKTFNFYPPKGTDIIYQ
jgi:outer membrane lipoprotein carrier protein